MYVVTIAAEWERASKLRYKTAPPFLIVHVDKPGVVACLSAERDVRLSGRDLHRFAAVYHTGETTKTGHYTATVATQASAFRL